MDLTNKADIVLSPAHNLQVITIIHSYLCCMGETLTDLQILGCKLHKNAFGCRAPPRPAGGAI